MRGGAYVCNGERLHESSDIGQRENDNRCSYPRALEASCTGCSKRPPNQHIGDRMIEAEVCVCDAKQSYRDLHIAQRFWLG